jgi:hypothetical protein
MVLKDANRNRTSPTAKSRRGELTWTEYLVPLPSYWGSTMMVPFIDG